MPDEIIVPAPIEKDPGLLFAEKITEQFAELTQAFHRTYAIQRTYAKIWKRLSREMHPGRFRFLRRYDTRGRRPKHCRRSRR